MPRKIKRKGGRSIKKIGRGNFSYPISRGNMGGGGPYFIHQQVPPSHLTKLEEILSEMRAKQTVMDTEMKGLRLDKAREVLPAQTEMEVAAANHKKVSFQIGGPYAIEADIANKKLAKVRAEDQIKTIEETGSSMRMAKKAGYLNSTVAQGFGVLALATTAGLSGIHLHDTYQKKTDPLGYGIQQGKEEGGRMGAAIVSKYTGGFDTALEWAGGKISGVKKYYNGGSTFVEAANVQVPANLLTVPYTDRNGPEKKQEAWDAMREGTLQRRHNKLKSDIFLEDALSRPIRGEL